MVELYRENKNLLFLIDLYLLKKVLKLKIGIGIKWFLIEYRNFLLFKWYFGNV